MGWRRRDLWLAGVNLFFSLGFYFGFFHFWSLFFHFGSMMSLVPLFLFSWDLVRRGFFFRAIEQSSWSAWVPVPATLYWDVLILVLLRLLFTFFYFPAPLFGGLILPLAVVHLLWSYDRLRWLAGAAEATCCSACPIHTIWIWLFVPCLMLSIGGLEVGRERSRSQPRDGPPYTPSGDPHGDWSPTPILHTWICGFAG